MNISTVRQLRDQATGLLRSKSLVLVTRGGRFAGIFFPTPQATLPIELKRVLFSLLSAEIAPRLRRRGVTEEEIETSFEAWRKGRRAARRRR